MSSLPDDRRLPEFGGDGRAEPLRVFVVENNDDTRMLLAMLIEERGDLVQSACSVAETLERYPDWYSDVLLCDLGLPDGSGWNLLESLRAEQPVPYAIAMSGFGSESDIERSRVAGFRHHIVKPVEPGKLDDLLDAARRERDSAS